ncbi:MAG: hypothetical protein HY899_12980 [Deltaproteobacteria bacterium]|nr:hypothetical protein [Deltaproteobacteria bacterium]
MKLLALEMRWLLAIADAILPSDAHERLPDGASAAPMAEFFDDVLVRSPLRPMLGLRAAIWAITLSPPLVIRSSRFFGGLSPEERVRHLATLGASEIYLLRELPVLIKTLALMGYGAMPDVQRAVGVEPAVSQPPVWARSEHAP